MLTAVVTITGAHVEVDFVPPPSVARAHRASTVSSHREEAAATRPRACSDGPSPIAPEVKELAWGAGSFIVLALLMRFLLFPRLKQGHGCRATPQIRAGHEQADAARAAARAEVAEYESALATVKAEANERDRRGAAHARVRAGRTARRGQRSDRRQA